MEYEGGDMTFWEQLKDAFNRFFGRMDEPVPLWTTLAIFAVLIGVVIMWVWYDREKSEPEDEPEEIEIPNPVAIKRQPAEVFETDCDLCGCGYRYTVGYVKDFTTVCPYCGTKKPHGPADTDIISRRESHE
jgi:hypothetical protein